MVITSSTAKSKLNNIFNNYGQLVRIKYYTTSGADASYDDDVVLTQSGSSLWISGMVQPIDQKRGSWDSVLMEQGKVMQNDSKLYIDGSVNTSGLVKIGLGSPIINEYSILELGVNAHNIGGQNVYKKIYIRALTNGSFIGE